MALKRKRIGTTKDFGSTSESDDASDIVPIIKTKKTYYFHSSDSENSELHDFTSAFKSATITDDGIPEQRNLFNFIEDTGPQCFLTHKAKPIEYFNLFFDSSLLTLMVSETNRYADELLQLSQSSDESRTNVWKPITMIEMRAFLAVLLEMGITKRPTISSYWSENSRDIPWFHKMFSRTRFQLILRFFHLVDNKKCFPPKHEKYDPCIKFTPIVEHANRLFKLYYKPHKELSIDESLVGTLCHSSITQYLPNKKHHRWGIKFWMLCDASSKYCLSFYCYQGAKALSDNTQSQHLGLGHNVVVNLLERSDYLNKGYHVFIDNFFSSIGLAKYLYSKNTYLTGTIRSNRKGVPNAFVKVDSKSALLKQ